MGILDKIKANETGIIEYFPFVQVVNPDVPKGKKPNPELFGLFLQNNEAERASFKPDSRWRKHTHNFSSGPSEGYICQNPRLVVVRRSGLGVFNRETGAFLGYYNKDKYVKGDHEIRTRYLLLFVDDNNEPLHDLPFQYTGKASFGASFGTEYSAFKNEFAKVTGNKRNDEFWKETVFEFTIQPEIKGKAPNQKTVSSVVEWVRPEPTDEVLGKMYLDVDLYPDTVAKIQKLYLENDGWGDFRKDRDPSDFASNPDAPPLPKVEGKKPQLSEKASKFLSKLKGNTTGVVTEEQDDTEAYEDINGFPSEAA